MDSIQPTEASYKDDYYKRSDSLIGSKEPKRHVSSAKVELINNGKKV